MSKSRRTDPPDPVARRRHEVDEDGDPRLPRIIERRPYSGDVHPIPKTVLQYLLPEVPLKYLYGLKAIELRGRQGPIGDQFGMYFPDEKTVRLFSLPLEWRFTRISNWLRRSLTTNGAEVPEGEDGVHVSRPKPAHL